MMHKNGMPNQPGQQSMTGMNRPPPPSQMLSGTIQPSVPHPSAMQHQVRPMMTGAGMPPSVVQQMMVQQQQQSMIPQGPSQSQPPMATVTSQIQPSQQHQPPPKQILCRLGADTVQDIVSKTLELFQHLRSMGPQLVSTNQLCEDKKNKIKDTIKHIETLFIRLRKIYNTCNEPSSLDYVDPKSLLPLRDDDDDDSDEDENKLNVNGQDGLANTASITLRPLLKEEKKNNPKLQQLEKDYLDLVELNRLKNRQIKEIIDRIRKMVWDINTMLAMRRP
ncbi:mediator complex subunit 30 [Dermatophagoides farinae]|nr:mediator of RNA polymerase II transcription subunit 30-like [Dermatophagoides farinae]